MSMQNVYFRGETAPNSRYSTPQQSQQVVTNPIVKNLRPDLISQEGAMAMRAYVLQDNLNFKGSKIENTATPQQYIEHLTSKGLKEGKDFIIEKDDKFTEIHLTKNGQSVKDMVWYKEDKGDVFECYRLNYHSQNNPIEGVTTCIGGDGNFRYRCKTYEKNPIKNDDINVNLSPIDYEEDLKKKDFKYTSDVKQTDNGHIEYKYTVYNPQTNLMTKVFFERDLAKGKNLCAHKEIYNANNEHVKTIHYYNDCTEITDFKEKPIYLS